MVLEHGSICVVDLAITMKLILHHLSKHSGLREYDLLQIHIALGAIFIGDAEPHGFLE